MVNIFTILKTYLAPHLSRVVVLTGLVMTSTGIALVGPRIMARFIDSAKAGDTISVLISLVSVYVALLILEQAVRVAETYAADMLAWNATNTLREHLFAHCLRLDMPFHNRRPPGELMSRIDEDVTHLEGFFSLLFIRLLSSALKLMGVLVLVTLVNWMLGLAFLGFMLLSVLMLAPVRKIGVPYVAELQETEAQYMGYLEEYISGREEIRSNGALPFALFGLERWMYERIRKARTSLFMQHIPLLITIFLYSLAHIIAVYSGYRMMTADLITIGTVYLIIEYMRLVLGPIDEIVQQVTYMQTAVASLGRIHDLQSLQPEVADTGTHELTPGAHRVQFDQVNFSYDDKPVLKNVSFDLQPGERLGLVGRTGSGKTTITRLLFRLYDHQSGLIQIDGTPISDLSLQSLRSQTGLVPQDVQLFHASLRENLRLYRSSVSDEALTAMIDRIGLHEWFQALPDGLDTPLSPGGENVSAGQAQLLGLARVFLKAPGIVILDEPTSRLDPATESLVKQVLDDLMRDRTAIVIAHHLSTIQSVDKILVLSEGEVVEFGEREALAANPDSAYAHLLRHAEGVSA